VYENIIKEQWVYNFDLPYNPKHQIIHYFNEHYNLILKIMLSQMKLRDDTEIRNYFGKKDRVIDIIIDLSKKDWTEPERKNELNKLSERINLDEMTRDIWFTGTSIEKIGHRGWNENGQVRKYPSANKSEIGNKHLVKISERDLVEYRFALLDKRQRDIVQFGEDGPSMHKMWRIKKEGIRFVLMLMSAKYVLGGHE